MVDIQEITTGLELNKDGIWCSKDVDNLCYPESGNEDCFTVEDNSFWFRHRNNCISSVVKAFPPDQNGVIFDIGGGNGFVSFGLAKAGFDVALVEPGMVGATNAKKRGIENIICATTNSAKFKQGTLPAVGLFDVVEHIEDDLSFLKETRNLMQKNGRLYITVPSYSFLWSEEDVFAGHFRRYTLKEITKTVRSAGYEIEFASYIFRFLPLPILLLRALPFRLGLSKKQKSAKEISKDHVVSSGATSSVINSILQTEIDNLDNKKAMSFGGSCLIVANCT